MGIADSTSRGSSGAFVGGLNAGIARRRNDQLERQQQLENYKAAYEDQKKQVAGVIASGIDQIGKQFIIAQRQVKAEGNDPTKVAAIEADYNKKMKDFRDGVARQAVQSTMKSMVEPMVQLGYLPQNQVDADMAAYDALFNKIRPDQEAIVAAIPKAAETAATAEATNESITFLIPSKTGKAEDNRIINVGSTDSEAIEKIRKQGGFPFKPSVQAANINDLSSLTKPVQTDLQKKLVGVKESRLRLAELKRDFKPEYFNVINRLGLAAQKAGEKFGVNVNKEDRESFKEFKQFGQKALLFINEEIHRLTGAQMSQFEAKRIRSSLPDFGEDTFNGNSANEFMANLESLDGTLAALGNRYEFFLKNGLLSEGDKITDEIASAYPIDNFKAGKVISTPEEYETLNSGDIFIDSSGKPKRKP